MVPPPAVGGLLALLFASLASVAHSAAVQGTVAYSLQLTGACKDQCILENLIYDFQGYTANGSPYYKGRGKKEYLYYDPDCTGGGDGTPRWILDDDKPALDKYTDLDNDKGCEYHARTNSYDGSHPPFAGTWFMKCGEAWQTRFVTLTEITSTSTSTSTTATTTTTETRTTTTKTSTTVSTTTTTRTSTTRTLTATATSTTATATSTTLTSTTPEATATSTSTATATTTTGATTASTTATETETETETTGPEPETTTARRPEVFVLEGACSFKNYLNGLRFVHQGVTANGARYYKATRGSREQYVYYDLDCSGAGDATPRWVIDDNAPNASLESDLDEDHACNYHARLEASPRSAQGRGPPVSADWSMFCGEGWKSVRLTLKREEAPEWAANGTDAQTLQSFFVNGACPEKDYLNGLEFMREGVTAIGSPYYRSVDMEQYMYFDRSCDGHPDTPARWIIDVDAPNVTLEVDLDDDGACDYHARTDFNDPDEPPLVATWRMICGHTWRDVVLTLSETMPDVSTHRPNAVISRASWLGTRPLLTAGSLAFLALLVARAP